MHFLKSNVFAARRWIYIRSLLLGSRGVFRGWRGHWDMPSLGAEGARLPLLLPWMEILVSGYCSLKKVNRNRHRRCSQKRSTKVALGTTIGGRTFSGREGGGELPRVRNESRKFSRQEVFTIVDPSSIYLF